MRFEIYKETLLPTLIALNGIIEKKQSLPILSNVLIGASDGEIHFSATDMEVERKMIIKNEVISSGTVTVPARKLLDICRSLPESAKIEVKSQNNKLAVMSGRSKFSLTVMPSEQFPTVGELPTHLEFYVPAAGLLDLFRKTQFAMAYQDVRYYLNGLLLEINDGVIKAVATDGHRLAVSELTSGVSGQAAKQIIIPRKGVIEIVKMLSGREEEIRISISDNHIRIVRESEDFISKLIDGRFPDYERVIPKRPLGIIAAKRISLKEGFSRASILSNEKFKGVRINIEPERLTATAHNADQEEAEEIIDVEYNGAPLEIGFNVSYLIDALGALDDEDVEIEVTDSSSSCLIRGKGKSDNRYVVMPMRL